jgi:DNA-binding helix-hairpin-helix protein with protein kinase domain
MQVLRCLPNQQAQPLKLTVNLGSGGEAKVYAVPNDANLVAKVYHTPSLIHARKLQVMLAYPPENPTANIGHISIAWPNELLRSDEGNQVVGFLMPRIRGMRPAIDFYNPRTRRIHCPLFNYQYLIRTARNTAAAFAALHNSGYCVGDVNESNILVSDTALVTLVDTDSFQVRDPRHHVVYRCQVGKAEFTPPELQNKTFAECDRTFAHDLFGLGVLIFQLLMEGTHPFSGIYQGLGEPPPYESRIANGHFTYGNKRNTPYQPTPISPTWEILHPSLQQLFISCFEDGHNNPSIRPSAQTWLLALTEAEENLVTCEINPQHRYGKHLHNCPWCERTLLLGGRDPFPSPQSVQRGEHLQQRKLTTKQRRPQPLSPSALFNSLQVNVPPTIIFGQQPKKRRRVYPIVGCLLGFGLLGSLDMMFKLTNNFFNFQNQYVNQIITSPNHRDKEDNVAATIKEGQNFYQLRDYENAIDRFSLAIEQAPDNPKVFMNRGNARYNLKDYEGALADYNQALEINAKEIKAYVNRGNIRYMIAEYSSDPDKEYKLALSDFNSALKINPKEVEAYIRRGIVLSQIAKYSGDSQRNYKNAIQDFNQAISIHPGKPEAYFQRGVTRYLNAQYTSNFEQEYKHAIDDFNRALSISPQSPKIYLKRGIVRYELAQYGGVYSDTNNQKAIDDLQTAAKISLEQDDIDSYQQALSSICVVAEHKCDTVLQNANSLIRSR